MFILISKSVEQRWNAKNKNYYVSLGYKFTKMKDSFEVAAKHLPHGSAIKVSVSCDYCGRIYEKSWYRYQLENANSTIHKDCCSFCKKYKIVEASLASYGVNSVLKLPEIQERISKTNFQKYGSKNPFQSDIIKEKIIKSNLKKYGVPHPMQNQVIRSKANLTCMKKYGVPNILYKYHKRGEDNHRWKGGVAYHRVERSTSEYIIWRRRVFARDNYTCQCCKAKSSVGHPVFLNAHHIYNWNDNPNKRFDVLNGITLCAECHLKFHKYYGKRQNDLDQLTFFLNDYGKKVC